MNLKRLDEKELTRLYQNDLRRDFPGAELKPLGAMLRLIERGQYDPLLALDDASPVGYAMVWLPPEKNGALLEYLGVFPDRRSGGLGAQILALLTQQYGQVFGEVEFPDSGDPAENGLRRRRIAFYERNGFRLLDYECALFGVHFNCMYHGPETDDRKVEALHRSVYASWFSPAHMRRYIQLPLRPGEAIHPSRGWLEETEPDEKA